MKENDFLNLPAAPLRLKSFGGQAARGHQRSQSRSDASTAFFTTEARRHGEGSIGVFVQAGGGVGVRIRVARNRSLPLDLRISVSLAKRVV